MLHVDGALGSSPSQSSISERWSSVRGADALAPLVGLLLVVLYVPDLMFPSWTPRFVLLLAVGPLGLVLLARQVARREHAAFVLAAALVWTVLVGAVGPAPRSALIGVVGRDLSALTVAFSAGLWSIGRASTERGRSALGAVLLWGASMNALVAVLQVIAEVESGPLALAAGRPTGLVTNPVYLGALCASATAAAVATAGARPLLQWVPPTALCGIAVALSGSRVALIAALVTCAALVAVRRTRWSMSGAGLVVVSLAAGVVIDRLVGAGRNAADRLAAGDGGGRTQAWRYGLEAWADRPIDGYGFGRFRPAVQSRFDVDFVRDFARDEVTQAWFDPHNAVIGLLVAVGVVGTLLFLAWAVLSLRVARGPQAWALLPLALHWMLQPLSLFTFPLAALLLGAAALAAPADQPVGPPALIRRRPRALMMGAGALGVMAALVVTVGDVSLRRAVDRADGSAAARSAELFLEDAVVSDLVSQVYDLQNAQPESGESSLVWRRHAVSAEPDRPFWWSLLARRLTAAGRFDEAEDALARAYELQPNNTRTLYADMQLAVALEDERRLADLLTRSCEFDLPECQLRAEDVIAEASTAAEDATGG